LRQRSGGAQVDRADRVLERHTRDTSRAAGDPGGLRPGGDGPGARSFPASACGRLPARMAKRPSKPRELPDALRDAVERTVQATVGSAGRSRDRTQGALDDLVETVDRLVKGAESSLSQRGKAAVDALEERRPVTHEDFRELQSELRKISRRLEAIEERLPAKRQPAAKTRPRS
ncbi:MAG TPA: hypothetical protein VEQ61_05480, partial [Thermoleophilaceae bacterium]|nr:hypothetical protein [Thermoleophilaceae bacterium]